MIRIGFTGTRHGLSAEQRRAMQRLIVDTLLVAGPGPFIAHHGLCLGGDDEFHDSVRPLPGAHIVGHPGPDWPDGKWCSQALCDETLARQPYMVRNAAIVAAVEVMIAAPLEDGPASGGTWATIRMARRALRDGRLRELHVVGRDGQLLDHTRWSL